MSEIRESIWRNRPSVNEINELFRDTLCDHLGIEITDVGPDSITGTMPVESRTCQPFGVMHGGASLALAESLASVAAYYCTPSKKTRVFGAEINANHLRSVSPPSSVTGVATPIHLGRATQVWQVEISNEAGQSVCICRTTIIAKESSATT